MHGTGGTGQQRGHPGGNNGRGFGKGAHVRLTTQHIMLRTTVFDIRRGIAGPRSRTGCAWHGTVKARWRPTHNLYQTLNKATETVLLPFTLQVILAMGLQNNLKGADVWMCRLWGVCMAVGRR